MAQINAPLLEEGKTKEDLRVNDPASGSGRTLLAFNKVAPGNYLIGQDIDAICTKMTAINLALHGCRGQAINGNSLNPEHFNFGYEINHNIFTIGGIPHIIPITKEQSVSYQIFQSKRGGDMPHDEMLAETTLKANSPVKQTVYQLKLF